MKWRHLLLGRKAMTNLDSVLKSRDILLLTKVRIVKAMVFPVLTYRCERWAIKKAECQRIDAFELWCWRRLLRVPWTARRSNQSILKEISPEYSLIGRTDVETETPILWPPHVKSWLIWKDPDEMARWHHGLDGCESEWIPGDGDGEGGLACCDSWGHKESDMTEWLNWTDWTELMLEKTEGRKRRGRQRMRWLGGILNLMDMGLGGLQELVIDRRAWRAWYMGSQRVGHDWVTELNWTEKQLSVHDICLKPNEYQ